MYEKPKKILVDGSDSMVVAHQLSDNMIEIVRMDQKFVITGKDVSIMATSPKHVNGKNVFTTITMTDGKVDEEELAYRPEKPKDERVPKLDDEGKPVLDDKGEPVYEDPQPVEPPQE